MTIYRSICKAIEGQNPIPWAITLAGLACGIALIVMIVTG